MCSLEVYFLCCLSFLHVLYQLQTDEDSGLKHWMCSSLKLWGKKIQNYGTIKFDSSCDINCSPHAGSVGFQNVNVFSGKVVSCRLGGCGSVLRHLNEWLSILLCLCVLCLFVFALWIFGKNHLHIWCFLPACTLLHFTKYPGCWNTDHKVCIVAVLNTDTHTLMHTLSIHM